MLAAYPQVAQKRDFYTARTHIHTYVHSTVIMQENLALFLGETCWSI